MNKFNERIVSFLIFVYFLLKPFYVFDSGSLQIADYVIVLLFLFSLLFTNERKSEIHQSVDFRRLILIFSVMVAYTFCVNAIWTVIIGEDLSMLSFSFFYLFNLLVLVAFYKIHQIWGAEFVFKKIGYAVMGSLFVQLALIPFSLTDNFRTLLYFNNPNQLGYYAILSISLIVICNYKVKFNQIALVLSYFICLYLSMLSLSKAAIISVLVVSLFFIIQFIRQNKSHRVLQFFIVILLLCSMYVVLTKFDKLVNIKLVNNVITRLDGIGQQNDDGLAGRGYMNIVDHFQYTFFGAGEGKYDRFNFPKEIHSTLFNVYFTYGMTGLILLLLIFYISIRKSNISQLYPLIGLFLYGLTHNGIRQAQLWILLLLIILLKESQSNKLTSRDV